MSGGTYGTNWLDLASTSNRCNRIYVQGFMDISGGNLIVRNNNLYLTQGDASINGNLILGRDASLNRRLFVGSDVSFGGNLYVAKNVGLGVSGSFGVYDVCNNAQMVVDISGGVNLRGPVMGGLTLPDQSVLMTAAPPLDISNNFGTVWRQNTSAPSALWRSSSMSANGQFQTACAYGGTYGYIYTSNNYGVTWTAVTSTGIKNFNMVSVSANGQYQTAVAYGNYIYTSSNYGVTWSAVTSAGIKNWYSIAISATGQYQTAAVSSDTIYVSNNYGVTWTQITSIIGKSIQCVAISATGQYQTAVAGSDYIYTSNNYGVTWTKDTSIGSVKNLQGVCMSANGQYQTAVEFNGNIYTSKNYGITWTQDTSVGSTKYFSGVSMSANGQYQTTGIYGLSGAGGYIYISTNYGVTWSAVTSAGVNVWCGISMSANGQYQTFVANNSYIYQSITPYNDLVVQNSLISYCDASINDLRIGRGGGNISTNTAFGVSVLTSNTTGINNVAFGYNALKANTTGNYNVSFGMSSLVSNTSGTFNLGVGDETLYSNTTGGLNVALGHGAGYNNTGSSNTAVGVSSLAGAVSSSGSYNTAVGESCLRSLTSGSNNTAFGYQAGQAGTANTTGSNNTYIGYQAQANGNSYSNSTALGSGATITASNQVVLGTSTEKVIVPGGITMNSTTSNVNFTTSSGCLNISQPNLGASDNLTLHFSGSESYLYIYAAAYLWVANSAKTCMRIGYPINTTNRSITAAGTVNTTGNDYAEYIEKDIDCGNIKKGDICGITGNDKLTDIYKNAVAFVIKSTNPSFVGGDTWGSETTTGVCPKKEDYTNDTDYQNDLNIWEANYEIIRIKYDRIALCGRVPLNIQSVLPKTGDYIIPIENEDGSIGYNCIQTPSFEQYMLSVGKVIKILSETQVMVLIKTC